MTLATSLHNIRDVGFERLYPIYGSLVDIVTITGGQSELLLQGSESVVYQDLKTLAFNLTTYEIEKYRTEVGIESRKFVMQSEIALIIKADYLVKYNDELYEIIEKNKRNLFNEWRVIGNKIQNA